MMSEQPRMADTSDNPVPPEVCAGITSSQFQRGLIPSSATQVEALANQFRCVSGTPLGCPVVPLVDECGQRDPRRCQ